MKKKDYKLTVIISIGMVLAIILLTSYAFWKVKDGQSGSNTILGSCLAIEFEEELDENDEPIIGISMDKAWPMSDEEGISTKGYTFTVKNTCDDAVNYEIVLETMKEVSPSNKMPDKYIKIRLDNGGVRKVSELEEVGNDSQATYASNIDKTYKVFTGTVTKDNPKTHTYRQWISFDAPSSTIGYNYKTKVKIYAGQGLGQPEYATTPEECFTFDSATGTITDYDLNNPVCSNKILVLPSTIGGVLVKSIMWAASVPDDIDWFWAGSAVPDILVDIWRDNNDASDIDWDYIDLSGAFGLEIIGDSAFSGYNGDNELILPNSLKKIGWGAFFSYETTNYDLIIPNSVTDIAPGAFYSFNGTNLIIGSSVKNIGQEAFKEYNGENSQLNIPISVESVGTLAFYKYVGPQLVLNEGLEYIGVQAFYKYNGGEFTIPSTIKTIGRYAFIVYNDDTDPNNPKVININMSETDFNDNTKVRIETPWYNSSPPILNYLVN